MLNLKQSAVALQFRGWLADFDDRSVAGQLLHHFFDVAYLAGGQAVRHVVEGHVVGGRVVGGHEFRGVVRTCGAGVAEFCVLQCCFHLGENTLSCDRGPLGLGHMISEMWDWI